MEMTSRQVKDEETGADGAAAVVRQNSAVDLLRSNSEAFFDSAAKWDDARIQRLVDGMDRDTMAEFLRKGVEEGFFQKGSFLSYRDIFYKRDGEVLLHDLSGIIDVGTMTAVLGGAENGAQAFLEVLSDMQTEGEVSGTVLVNGAGKSRSFRKQIGYVPVDDIHLPMYKVREACLFSARTRLPGHMADALKRIKVEIVLKMLGLAHCADTIAGDQEHRGVSGGEKRRLSIAVELVVGHSLLFADRPTNGLDSAAALDFVRLCRSLTAAGVSMVHALVQPSNAILEQYDNVVVLCRGRSIYTGPVHEAEAYFATLGFARPPTKSLADYLQEMSLFPERFHRPRIAAKQIAPHITEEDADADADAGADASADAGAGAKSPVQAEEVRLADGRTVARGDARAPWPLSAPRLRVEARIQAELRAMPRARTTADAMRQLEAGLRDSERWEALGRRMWAAKGAPLFRSEDKGTEYNTSLGTQVKECVRREAVTFARNRTAHIALVVKSCVVALIAGSVFFAVGNTQADVRARPGFLFFCLISAAFSNLSLVTELFEARRVFFMQKRSGYFRGAAYYAALLSNLVPLAFIEMLSFTAISHAMVDLQGPVFGGNYWVFFLCVFQVNVIAKCWVIFTAHWSPNDQVAQVITPVFMVINFLLCGFLAPRETIPDGWRWAYFLSFFTFPLRAVSVNEHIGLTFSCNDPVAVLPGGQKICLATTGNDVLKLYSMEVAPGTDVGAFKAHLVGLGFAFVAFYILLSLWAVSRLDRNNESKSDVLTDVDRPAEDDGSGGADAARAEGGAGAGGEEKDDGTRDTRTESNASTWDNVRMTTHKSVGLAPPKVSLTMAFHDLDYFVPVKGGEKQLLHSVYGYAKPGMLIALMGPSGSGKTTLLDVLGDRKTGQGTTKGSILFNNRPRDPDTFAKVAGYVEQVDSHEPFATVREAIEFSAALRLPAAMSAAEKEQRVEEVIDTLGLREVEHELIGGDEVPGIPPEMRKKVSIAVELVINPAILLLDEPSTGLDSVSASRVVQTIKRLSKDICVVCTIHQPSAELFSYFDHILLLTKGGKMAYFGETAALPAYFRAVDLGTAPADANVADFALEVTGAGISGGSAQAADDLIARVSGAYLASDQHVAMRDAVDREKQANTAALAERVEATPGFGTQFGTTLAREMRIVKRDKGLRGSVLGASLNMSFIVGTLYWQLSDNQLDASNRLSVALNALMFLTFSSSSVMPIRLTRRIIIFRERKSRMYGAVPYFLARYLAEWPVRLVQVTIFSLFIYWFAGLNPDAGRFFLFLLGCFVAVLNGTGIAEVMATLMPNGALAALGHTVYLVVNLLTSGFFAPKSALPSGWLWLYTVNFFRFPLNFLAANEYDGLTFSCPNNVGAIPNGQGGFVCPITKGSDILDTFSIDSGDLYLFLLYACLFQVAMRTISCLGLKYVNHIKR